MYRQHLETIIYEKGGSVARIVLNRPENANAQNPALVKDLEFCLTDAEHDYDIKVAILKANGRGFSAGHDVVAAAERPEGGTGFPEFDRAREAGPFWQGEVELFLWPVLHLWEFQKPIISAVQGYAIGAGTYLALIPDMVIAADDSYFQMPLVQGLGFPGGQTMIEPWVFMNYHRAYEYLYTAQTVPAEEAERLGLVNRVVPLADLNETVEILAAQIAQAPLSTLMATKSLVKRAWEMMGLRVHWQSSQQVMAMVGQAGDVAAWRAENVERGYGQVPRQVAARRFAEAAEAARKIDGAP